MGADCKSAGYAYVGSNPTRPTTFFHRLHSSAVEHSLGKGEVTSSILVEGFISVYLGPTEYKLNAMNLGHTVTSWTGRP